MLNILKCVAAAAVLCASANAKDAVLPRDGDYLSTAYLAALDKTMSHNKAAATGSPQAISISRDKRGLVLDLVINWHEGTGAVFDLNNPAQQIDADGDFKRTFIPVDATHFRYDDGVGGSGLQTYEYVGKVERFITKNLLVGVYADTRGRKYVFGADGKAQFPRKSFRYEIYTDVVFENCDLVSNMDVSKPGAWKAYGFAWKGDALFLYSADCNVEDQPGCVVDRARPIAVLHKVVPKE